IDQVSGIFGVPPYAESEDDLTLLPGGQIEAHLDRGARVQTCSRLSGKPQPGHSGGTAKRAVASQEFSPIAAYRASRIVHVEERCPVAELRVVRVAREERATVRVNSGDHVH